MSIWNENKRRFIISKDKVVLNVWASRSATDFLHYLKFEFIQYTFHGSFIIVSILVMPQLNQTSENPENINPDIDDWESLDANYNRHNIEFLVAAALEFILLRVTFSQAMGGSVT